MKLMECVPDASAKSVYLSWADFPENVAGFYVYVFDRKAPGDPSADVPESSELIATTQDPFYTDYRFFQGTILDRDMLYLIRAMDGSGKVVDSLNITPMKSRSVLIQQKINGANYAAQQLFRNYNWADHLYILRYKKTGKKCNCYIQDFGSSGNPDCPICFGGGYEGGFYTPIPTRILPINQRRTNKASYAAEPLASDQRNLTVPRFPAVYEKDLLYSDRLGLMEVIDSDFKNIQASPTPTLMLTTAALGREHPAHKFDFDKLKVTVSKITCGNPAGTVTVTGTALIPMLGSLSLRLIGDSETTNEEIILGVKNIKSNSDDHITFTSDKVEGYGTRFRYKLAINNELIDGFVF
jgi:hypothetical protein